jgi:hypothetical protein
MWKIFLLTLPLTFWSCTKDARNSLRAIPTAFGTLNEIVVIAETELWTGNLGDSVMHYYTAAYPILPQPEPIFDIRHFSGEQLLADPFRKELRTYLIIANLADEASVVTQMLLRDIGEENFEKAKTDKTFHSLVGKDKWAKGQIIIYQFAYTEEDLIRNLIQDFPLIRKRVYDADKSKLDGNVYLQGVNQNTIQTIQSTFNIELKIPKDYIIALNDDKVAWLRKETENLSSNILITKFPYTNQTQLTPDGLKEVLNDLGKHYITSAIEGSFMRINDRDLPFITKPISISNKYCLEGRGIWEMENDYMGGPLISYIVHNPAKDELILLNGFVYAPGQDKRDYIMALEHIFRSIKI